MPPTQIGNTLSATNHETSTLSRRELWGWSTAFGLLTLLIHLPFVYRYDLFLGSDSVINMLIDKRILIGELGAFPWGADYNGKGPVSLLNVLAYAIFGCSIPLTCFLSLFAWSIGTPLHALERVPPLPAGLHWRSGCHFF